MKNIQKLVLGRNKISKISSEFKIDPENFESLTVLNLQENGIESWDELVGLSGIQFLRWLNLIDNKIPEIYRVPGFPY